MERGELGWKGRCVGARRVGHIISGKRKVRRLQPSDGCSPPPRELPYSCNHDFPALPPESSEDVNLHRLQCMAMK